MSARKPDPVFDASVRFDNLPPEGRRLDVKTTAEERERVAELLNVDSVDRLTASIDVRPVKGGLHATGRLDAVVVQPCVVTFEPVSQTISEKVNRIFIAGREADYQGPAGGEVFVDLEGDDLPDYFEGPEVDLAPLILETLSLAIDPYPRAPGAKVPQIGDDTEEASPFSGLKHLKSTRD